MSALLDNQNIEVDLQKHRFWLRFGTQVEAYEAQFGVPGGVRPKKGKGLKSSRIFRPMLGANMRSKILFYVARRAQEPSGEGPGGVFLRVKI